jgi:succinate dehydrogenase/fumarate reductase flavoprotein subunit
MSSLMKVGRWDDHADVVILGFGLAGAVAAIEAYDTDPEADILIVEKNPEHEVGGNSRVSGQGMSFPEDAERLLAYQQALNAPNPVPETTLRAWAQAMIDQQPWIARMAKEAGMAMVSHTEPPHRQGPEYPEMPGSGTISSSRSISPAPSGVWNCFKLHVDRRPIRTRFGARAIDLVQDPDTLEVFGVVVDHGGARLAIRARRAVVMCVGGFAGNREMNLNYCGLDVYPIGNPANTGDGVRMLQKAGAELWHMRNRNQTAGIWPAMKFPEFEAAFFRTPMLSSSSWIDVARDNRRFYNEGAQLAHTHHRIKAHDNWLDAPYPSALPIHMLFDEKTRATDCLAIDGMTWNPLIEGYQWSPDNSAEIKRGWIAKADSIRELARIIGRDPDGIEATVTRYNRCARAAYDPDFGRASARMQPIDRPPFYAVEIVVGILSTTGGAKRDEEARVISQDGDPIPHLYEAGELGSILANLYENGSFLSDCFVSGRAAGRNAVHDSSRADALAES